MKNTISNSFRSVGDIFADLPSFDTLLPTHALYHGHKDAARREKVESLIEHVDLVNDYFQRLCKIHQLDSVIDALINDVLVQFNISKDTVTMGDWVKEMFCLSIYCHDFGKINPNFQSERLKNNQFKPEQSPLTYYHSQLGAYMYMMYVAERIEKSGFSDDAAAVLYQIGFALSYPIFQHHSPFLAQLQEGVVFEHDKAAKMLELLQKYAFERHDEDLTHELVSDPSRFWDLTSAKLSFPLFTLVKLNFSMLTASDYLATHEYMNLPKNETLTEFGVLEDDVKQHIFKSIRTTEGYNAETFKNFKENKTPSVSEVESKENLNFLRQKMALEVLRNVSLYKKERLFYIEAPTGGGKTNLSLLATAELLKYNTELNKVFYVFPFTTLITQTHKVVKHIFGLDDTFVAELHSKAGLKEATEEEKDEKKKDYGDEKADYIAHLFGNYPITLLSHVRFFDILKGNGKEKNYWLHRLANSVVVIDEIQAYSPEIWDKMAFFMTEYACYFNIRFIVMSATLPKLDKLLNDKTYKEANIQKPAFHRLLPNAKDYFTNPNFSKRVEFKFDLLENPLFEPNGKGVTEQEKEDKLDILADEVLAKSVDYANKKGRVFTIIEFIFKKTATQFADIIGKKDAFFDEIFVLSGTILEHRRREIINFLKRNTDSKIKVLLITTQVVEAGVDIDMDLGFKDTSLIDSDEQLAGRINRNVTKPQCQLYLFNLDQANVIYGKDKRFDGIKDGTISTVEHRQILETKNFDKLYYDEVFKKIDKRNDSNIIKNFTDYLVAMKQLDYSEVDKGFKIIDQHNVSVFVPILIPVKVQGGNPKKLDESEEIFTKQNLDFLKDYGNIEVENDEKGSPSISGKKVFDFYMNLVRKKKEMGFVQSRIDFKKLGGIMSKFTFSLMAHSKDIEKLQSSGFVQELFGFIYILDTNETVYSTRIGLNTDNDTFKNSNQF